MQVIRQFIGGAIICLMALLAGVLILIDPAGTIRNILICTGIGLMAWGMIRIAGYCISEVNIAATRKGLFHGLCLLSCGSIIAVYSEFWLTRIGILIAILGCTIFISGLNKIQWAANMFRLKKGRWVLTALSAIFSLSLGITVIRIPFMRPTMMWNLIGVILIAEAVCNVSTFLFCGSNCSRMQAQNAED